ncbi:MAG: substrate-binding domain-containing protein [Lachnospiraceae bacterium]|nr:substrate-binding domain-containing protein [Lachnospiraceae bacterium]
MKKKALSIILSLAMVTALTACTDTAAGTAAPAAEPAPAAEEPAPAAEEPAPAAEEAAPAADAGGELSIDVILKTTSSEYWGYVLSGAESYMEDHPNVKVEVKGATSETAYDEQQNMIETDLNSGAYDGFVIAPLQADLVSTLIAGQTKPIVAVDTKIEAPEILSFIGTNNEDAAKMGGEEAVKAAKAAGWDEVKAICISGVQGDGTAAARLSGYQKGIEGAGGEFLVDEIQYSDAVADKAVTCMEAIMQNHPEGIAIICTHNDDTAMAAARAAKDNEAYKNTIFLGFDGIQSACNAIIAGEETMSVAQEAYDMGYKAVDAVVRAIGGETLDAFIDSGCSVVTPENAQDRLDALQSYLN